MKAKISPESSSILILEWLRKNTDEENPVKNVNQMINGSKKIDFEGDKATLSRRIKVMAKYLMENEFDTFGKIRLKDGKSKDYISEDDMIYEIDNDDLEMISPKEIYYEHTFDKNEIDIIVEGVLLSKKIDYKHAKKLKEKIIKSLASKYYKDRFDEIYKIYEKSTENSKLIYKNIEIIQQAAKERKTIDFSFNMYDKNKNIQFLKTKKYLSPYYVVLNNGKYYMIGCDNVEKKEGFIWRVDLMTDIKINSSEKSRDKYIRKEDIKRNIFYEVDSDEFIIKHLDMSYDTPKTITMKLFKKAKLKDGKEVYNYTILYDKFGNNFEVLDETEEYSKVRVTASPFGVVNWSLGYSSDIEIIKPDYVRKMAKDRVNMLLEKYKNDIVEE